MYCTISSRTKATAPESNQVSSQRCGSLYRTPSLSLYRISFIPFGLNRPKRTVTASGCNIPLLAHGSSLAPSPLSCPCPWLPHAPCRTCRRSSFLRLIASTRLPAAAAHPTRAISSQSHHAVTRTAAPLERKTDYPSQPSTDYLLNMSTSHQQQPQLPSPTHPLSHPPQPAVISSQEQEERERDELTTKGRKRKRLAKACSACHVSWTA